MIDPHPPDAAGQAEEVTDQELVARAQGGDLEAYNELIRRHHRKIYAMVYNMTSNKEDAEDLTQDIFYKAYSVLNKFKGDASFYTWIYRIAVNRTINYVKRRNKRAGLSLDDVDLGIERDPAFLELSARESPFRECTLTELQEKLNKALMTLSEKHRTVVVLHDIQGIPHDEIAKLLNVSSGTVRSRLFYARKALQVELSEYAP
ncbi:MAG: sigma-70 family RNA polymerase sigma factor [Verrucomicrobia bacterium]|nr:sigma-70 family RNA polymerase sigma factor [Kiritimatiellia bacterium]MCP5487072.1 sigma-70 family RNA polymerase sigma factor [Verrucomicrobiota bacterium]